MPNITEPTVTLIAHSMLERGLDSQPAIARFMEELDAPDAETLTEFAGRVRDQSFNRTDAEDDTTQNYLDDALLMKGRWSIAEHATATVYITGVSQAFSRKLIGCRDLHVNELTQQFVDEHPMNIVVPPVLRGDDIPGKELLSLIHI